MPAVWHAACTCGTCVPGQRLGQDVHTPSCDSVRQIAARQSGDRVSYFLERMPGCFIQLGAWPDDVPSECAQSNHSATVHFDDSVLGEQAAALAELAVAPP